jgi:hypothetical protein
MTGRDDYSGHTGQHACCRLCRLRNLPADHTVTVPLTVTRPVIRERVDMQTQYLRDLDNAE